MWTKSMIQMIRESCEVMSDYHKQLNDLMEKYNIEDNIFIYRNGVINEVRKGYFEVYNTYNTLNEALKGCNGQFNSMGIRISDNQSFQVGYVREFLSECSEDSVVLDINNMVDVR